MYGTATSKKILVIPRQDEPQISVVSIAEESPPGRFGESITKKTGEKRMEGTRWGINNCRQDRIHELMERYTPWKLQSTEEVRTVYARNMVGDGAL